MPKIPPHLQKTRTTTKLKDLMNEIVDRPVTANPAILLHPQIPKPMHGMAPRSVLGKVWWNKEREAAYASTNYHCEACGVPKWQAKYKQWLEAHEVYRIDYLKGRMIYERACPLCHYCHNYIHSGRLQWLFETRQINHIKYAAIIQHGDQVLAKAGLRKQAPYAGPTADWTEWHLVINGVEYPGKFKSMDDWLQYHGQSLEE